MSAVIRQMVLRKRADEAFVARRDALVAEARGETGSTPEHEWDGTKLRFQHADGTWGEWVDLRGTKGKPGQDGKTIERVVVSGGGSRKVSEDAVPQSKRIDVIDDSLMYRGEAAPGADETAPQWRVARITFSPEGDITEMWAGAAQYQFAWADRATLTYA
jgi:hypothetical protein